MQNREIKYSAAIWEATNLCMAKYPSVFIIGLGVPDPKGIFGTTLGLVDKYGPERVMDMPLSENAILGVCIGAALNGMRPIMTHQRMDFTLLLMDQLVNNASKWSYMFGRGVPIVLRMIIGRGWGQGPHHSQSLQALYTHIPGLKVVMPTTPYDAKGLLISSIEDNNPVIFIEHRWLYHISGYVPKKMYRVPIGKAKIIREGKDVTIVATSHMTIESLKASKVLERMGIEVEIIDVRTLKPLDENLIIQSVKKTKRVIVADSGWKTGGIAGEIIAQISEKAFDDMVCAPQRITLPDIPTPTSSSLIKYYYPSVFDIVKRVLTLVGIKKSKIEIEKFLKSEKRGIPVDVPDLSFTGPF